MVAISDLSAGEGPHALVVSVHVPKAAGTSLFSAFRSAFGDDAVCRVDDDPLDPLAKCNIDPVGYLAAARSSGVPCGARVVHGHFWAKRFEDIEDAVRITVLRDPVERLVSHYFFWKHAVRRGHGLHEYMRENDLTLEEFANLPMIARLYSQVFFREIDMASFDFITDVSTLSTDLPVLSRLLGVDLLVNVSNTNPEPAYADARNAVMQDAALLGRIRAALRDDIQFYERALSRRSSYAV